MRATRCSLRRCCLSAATASTSISRNGIDIHLTLLQPRELRCLLKASVEGKPLERARREAVEALLAAD
ncbi:MAG: hypothetical protein HYS65_16295 [Betaproteobacteria bacterium]|nr:hypothetical protein [Betaproteobacteria bacterium]